MTPEASGKVPHRYEEIANDLRTAIQNGDYREGDRLPGENAIMRSYDVARMTARDALAVLRHEGIAVARPGAGVFVAPRSRIIRDSDKRYSRTRAGDSSPFRSDASQVGQHGNWEYTSRRVRASPEIARRLDLTPGDPVMETAYRFLSNRRPVQISRSWEPLAITEGTPVELPEDGAATGVIARMDAIGHRIDRVIERVTARAARSDEVKDLRLAPRGSYVLVIERTHYERESPLETCDIIFPGDRYELTYTIPVPG